MNLKYNVIGKIDGKTVVAKYGMTYPDARELTQAWEQQGCSVIMDDCRQLVTLDQIDMYGTEPIWSGGAKEAELETAEYMRDLADRQREWDWKADRDKEAKVGA